jgi:hypothetical protein
MTTDEPIAFEYASSEPDDERRRCPICRKIILRHEESTYYREGSEDRIQCCTDCREDFERSSGHTLEADVLESSLFDAFHRWALREIQFKLDPS